MTPSISRKNPRASIEDAWDALAHGDKRLTRVSDGLREIRPELDSVIAEIRPKLTQEQFDTLRDAQSLLTALEQSCRKDIAHWAYFIDFEKPAIRRRRRGPPGHARARATRGNRAANYVEDLVLEQGWKQAAAVDQAAEKFGIEKSEINDQLAILRGTRPQSTGIYLTFAKKRRVRKAPS